MDTNDRAKLKAFGDRLRELRKKQGIAQEKLALISCLARSYVGEVERGNQNISLLNIHKLAEALNVAPSVLLETPLES
ncbi:helix-turn-helix domain-containing protein [Aquirhabdus sp.]|uniref:helix-turn-helix domain-containing protein n=1 Tax=Aquirhabdus sp. TaxID=2824160 RepID=UPI00396C3473